MNLDDTWTLALKGKGYVVKSGGRVFYRGGPNGYVPNLPWVFIGETDLAPEDLWWTLDAMNWPTSQVLCGMCGQDPAPLGEYCGPCSRIDVDETRGEMQRERAEEATWI